MRATETVTGSAEPPVRAGLGWAMPLPAAGGLGWAPTKKVAARRGLPTVSPFLGSAVEMLPVVELTRTPPPNFPFSSDLGRSQGGGSNRAGGGAQPPLSPPLAPPLCTYEYSVRLYTDYCEVTYKLHEITRGIYHDYIPSEPMITRVRQPLRVSRQPLHFSFSLPVL